MPMYRWLRLIVVVIIFLGSPPHGWWHDRHAAMVRLVGQLEHWAAGSGENVIVVFERPPHPPIRSSVIEVAHAKRARANSADDEIVRRLAAAGDAHDVRVVTSDGWLADRVRAAGGSVEPAQAFRNAMDPA